LNIQQTDLLIPKVIETDSGLNITNALMPVSYLQLFKKQLIIGDISVLYKMLNDSRKLVKSGELLPKLFDKLYIRKNELTENAAKEIKISPIAFKILDKLSSSNGAKFYIINRDKIDLSEDFVSFLKPNISFLDIKNESEIYTNNNPHLWEVTSKEGHWNIEAHKTVGEYLTVKLLNE
jgi:hypothetical protein